MIGFRDMTFCEHWRDCAKASQCCRPLTDEVLAAAREWWGKDGAPIVVFASKPTCHEAKDTKP